MDIISSVDLDTVLPGYIVSKWRNKKIVFDAHEYFTELPELANRPFVKKVWNSIANTCLPNIKSSYTVNQSLAKIFEEKYHVKYGYIRSITKYIDTDKLLNPQRKNYILYQGALNVGRGLEVAIEAMNEIDQSIHLFIAGEGDIKEDLVLLVEKYKLEQRVVFLGNLSPQELAKTTQNAYMGLNLLASNSLNYYYSLANKFFDYIHAGVPSINMDFPEYRLLNDQYNVGLLVKDLDTEMIVDSIKSLIEDIELYEKLQMNCLMARKKINWGIEEERLLDIYRDL